MRLFASLSRLRNLGAAAILCTIMSLLASVAPAYADVWNPVPPSSIDRGGTSQDQYYIPLDDNGTSYFLKGSDVALNEGVWYPTGGVQQVVIVATFYTGESKEFPPLVFTDGPTDQAPNTLSVIGDPICNTATKGTKITVMFGNSDDVSDLSVFGPFFSTHMVDGDGMFAVLTLGEVLDGTSVTWTGGDDPAFDQEFLLPGTHTLRFAYYTTADQKATSLVYRDVEKTLWIPPCGGLEPPPGDTGPSGSGGATTGQPSGSVKRLGCLSHKVKRVMDTRQVKQGKTKYIWIKKFRSGVVKKKQIWVKPGQLLRKTFKGNAGDKFILKYKAVVKGKTKTITKSKVIPSLCS